MYEQVDIYQNIFHGMRPDFPFIWAVLEVVQPSVIAEYGAGAGRLLSLYKQTDALSVVGLDLETKMVESFILNGGDQERIKAYEQDICSISPYIKNAGIVIMTSSVMKHIPVSMRKKAWKSIYESIGEDTILFLDHCAYVYDVKSSCEWQNYYKTLKFWWDEEDRNKLKSFEWKKEVDGIYDRLYYRMKDSDNLVKIETFVYEIEALQSDCTNAGFCYSEISDTFLYPSNHHPTKRSIALLAKKSFGKESLDRKVAKIKKVLHHEL